MARNFLEPRFVGPISLILMVLLFISTAGSLSNVVNSLNPFHVVEFSVLLLVLVISQLNYQTLFDNLGRIVADQNFRIISRKNYCVRLHHFVALLPISFGVVFLAMPASCPATLGPPLLYACKAGTLSVLYLCALALLYAWYCFTNKVTLIILSDTIQAAGDKLDSDEYTQKLMIEIGNNILFLKAENWPALLGYGFLVVTSGILLGYNQDIQHFLAGAATVHLAISAFRFYTLARDTTRQKESQRDAIEILTAHTSAIRNRFPTLANTLRAIGKGPLLFFAAALGSVVVFVAFLHWGWLNVISDFVRSVQDGLWHDFPTWLVGGCSECHGLTSNPGS